MQEEIFGPVLVATAFRTPAEAVALANNTRYGLAASIWTENINLALDLAPKIICGVAWINSTNQFDASAGFGGRRESGFGREGGWEGLYAYARSIHQSDEPWKELPPRKEHPSHPILVSTGHPNYSLGENRRDRTVDTRIRFSNDGKQMGLVGQGNRKDIRNAVEAANATRSWGKSTAHLRAQILYYLGENLSIRTDEFAGRISDMTGHNLEEAKEEVQLSIERLFAYAALVRVNMMLLLMEHPFGELPWQ